MAARGIAGIAQIDGLADGGLVHRIAKFADRVDNFLGIAGSPSARTAPAPAPRPQPQQTATAQQQAVTDVKSRRNQEAEIMKGLANGGGITDGLIPGKVDPAVADDVTINAKKGEYVLSVEDVKLLGGPEAVEAMVKRMRAQAGLPTHTGPKRHDQPDSLGRMDKPKLRGIADVPGLAGGGLLKTWNDSNDASNRELERNFPGTATAPVQSKEQSLADAGVAIAKPRGISTIAGDASTPFVPAFQGTPTPATPSPTPNVWQQIYSAQPKPKPVLNVDAATQKPIAGQVASPTPSPVPTSKPAGIASGASIQLDSNKGLGDTTAISNRVDWSPGSTNDNATRIAAGLAPLQPIASTRTASRSTPVIANKPAGISSVDSLLLSNPDKMRAWSRDIGASREPAATRQGIADMSAPRDQTSADLLAMRDNYQLKRRNTAEGRIQANDELINLRQQIASDPSVIGNQYNGAEQVAAARNAIDTLNDQNKQLRTGIAGDQALQAHKLAADAGIAGHRIAADATIKAAGLTAEGRELAALNAHQNDAMKTQIALNKDQRKQITDALSSMGADQSEDNVRLYTKHMTDSSNWNTRANNLFSSMDPAIGPKYADAFHRYISADPKSQADLAKNDQTIIQLLSYIQQRDPSILKKPVMPTNLRPAKNIGFAGMNNDQPQS